MDELLHEVECYSAFKKEWNPDPYSKVDRSGDCHVKQTKAGTENQILHVLSYTWELKKKNSTVGWNLK